MADDDTFSSVTGSHHIYDLALILETSNGTMTGPPSYGNPFIGSDKRHRIGADVNWRLGMDWKKKKVYELGSRSFYTIIPTELDVFPRVTFTPCGTGLYNLLAMALGITANVESPAAVPTVSATMIAKVSDGTRTHYIIETGLLVNKISFSANYTDPPEVTVEFVGQWGEFDLDGTVTSFLSKEFPTAALAAMTSDPLGPKDTILTYSTQQPSAADLPASSTWPTVQRLVLSINNNFKKQPCAIAGFDGTYRAMANRYVPGELQVELAVTDRQYQNTSDSVLPDRNMYDYLANIGLVRSKLTIDTSQYLRLGQYWTGAAAAGNSNFWLNPPDHGFKANSPELERTHLLAVSTVRAYLGTLWA